MNTKLVIAATTAVAILALFLGYAALDTIKAWTTTNPQQAFGALLAVGGIVVVIAGTKRVGKHGTYAGLGIIALGALIFLTG